ncbi:DUF4012 domain-containing protein [Euzebya rosea]|uniref:DUF4012 domain-containing protein n=1 Tax=Euzebya rosea TaxID=2052804 RepID=UPI000D3E4689|nr:DUF4012 domain-containing protein [Euzebya rosea]
MSEQDDIEVIDLRQRVETLPRQTRLVPPTERDGRGSVGRSPRRRWAGAVVGALLVVGLAWAGVAALTLLRIRGDVGDTRTALLDARSVLTAGEVERAAELFGIAAADLRDLPDRVTGPAVWPARLVPTYNRTLDAVAELGRAGGLAAAAAGQVAEVLAEGEGGLGALTPRDGRVPVDRIAALTPMLEAAAADVGTALQMARDVPTTGVDDAVVEGRREFIEVLEPTADQLALGAEVTEVLPRIFGADGPRRYVVMASNPTEARGTGGFFGGYTVMEADNGELSFGPVGETLDLPVPPDPSVVEWVDPSLEERWALYGGSTRIRSINMTPDFPSAAGMVENYWASVLGDPVDGVIAVDPFAFEAMLEINGPIQVGDLGEVSSTEVVEFVSHSAYSLIGNPIERKRLIGNVAAQTLQGFLDGPGDVTPAAVLDALGSMTARDSLLIHSVHPDEQALLEEANLAGKLEAGPGDMLAIILNSGSGSKIDYFLDRTVRYDVALEDDGVATGVVSAGFVNTAPTSGELAYMIGPPDTPVDFGAGDNVTYVSVYTAPGTTFFETPDIGYADLPTSSSIELGFPVASTWMLIPSGQSRELIYSWSTPGAWTEEGDEVVYALRYIHQTAVRQTEVEVRVAVPDGMDAVDLPPGAEVVDGEVILTLEPQSDVDLEVRFAPRR